MSADASAQLARIAAALRETGERGLARELRAGLRTGAKPLIEEVQAAARRQLPKSGGLNERVASDRVTVSTLLSKRTAAVRLKTKTRETRQTDKGYVRHPVFGTWLAGQPSQPIPQAEGWWSKTLERHSPEVTSALLAVMRAVAAKLEGGA